MKRSLFYIALAIGLTYLVREVLYAGIRRNTGGEFAKLREVFLEKNKYDLLIVGSSRAESQFDPRIIDSIAGTHSYNIGILGATMPFIDGAFEAYLSKSDAPKYAVLNIDYHVFTDNTDTIHQFPRYFPYFGNDVLYQRFSDRDVRLKFAKYIPFYSLGLSNVRYLNAAVRGWAGRPGKFDTLAYQGYSPVPYLVDHPINIDTLPYKPYTSTPPAAIMKSTNDLIARCKAKHIQLILVISPLYYRQSEALQNEKELVESYHRLAEKKQLQLFDYSADSMRFDRKNFMDPAHFSLQGAKTFSKKFGADLKAYMEKTP